MAVSPISGLSGDPVAGLQSESVVAIGRFTRQAANAGSRLTSGERLTNAGEDPQAFATSRRIRSQVASLKSVVSSSQLNVTAVSLAGEALNGIKTQLDNIKNSIVAAQTASTEERTTLQNQIDLSLAAIDATARNTKLGSRSLLDGSSTVRAVRSINTAGTQTDLNILGGLSIAQTSGLQAVRVNKIGSGGATRTLTDGRQVLSLRVSLLSSSRAAKAFLSITTTGAANTFSEFRITGKLGSATIRIDSSRNELSELSAVGSAFNALADQTGVILTSKGGQAGFSTVGFGPDEFIKVEFIAGTGAGAAIGGVGSLTTSALGETAISYGRGASVRVNGTTVQLGGDNGLTGRYQANGYDIEFDMTTRSLATRPTTAGASGTNAAFSINVDLSSGLAGAIGASGSGGDLVRYGFSNFTTANLGKGAAQHTVTLVSNGAINATTAALGDKVIGQFSVAELGSGGRASLSSGNLSESLKTVDRAVSQVIKEQTRLGQLQGLFSDAIANAQVSVGNLTAADADIVGVDAASEITNLVQAQLGVSTASSILGQANTIQVGILNLLRS